MLEHKLVFPRNLGKQARNRLILPNRNYLITRRQLDQLNGKILRIQFKGFTTVTKVLHYLLYFIQSLLLTWM